MKVTFFPTQKLIAALFLTLLMAPVEPKTTSSFLATLSQTTGIGPDQPFMAEKITFHCDIPFSKDEFFYLTDLKPKTTITLKDLCRARTQLKRKKRFCTIDISISRGNIHFSLAANWIFKQITVKGIWFGKHSFENLYLHSPGDIFDISLHEESLAAIKKSLYERGYFNSSVVDEIIYNQKEKTIDILITIKKRKKFRISNILCNYRDKQDPEMPALIKRIQDSCEERFAYHDFSKKLVTKIKEHISTMLTAEGFTKSNISIKKCIKNTDKTITILFDLILGKKLFLSFEGNKFFSKKDFYEKIIDMSQPEWLLDPNIITEQILHAYYQHGFWTAKINYKTLLPSTYHLQITEGPRIRIDKVILKNYPSKQEEQNKFFFQPLLDNKFYDENILNSCLEKLKVFYIEHGFWDFSITNQQFIKQRPGTFTILYNVNKGMQRFLNKIFIKNFQELEQTLFFQEYNQKHKTPLNPAWLSAQRLFLLDHFQKQGYWYVDAQPEFKIDKKQVSIYWNVTPGEQVRFDKVLIRGHTRLPFKRIIKEVQFKQGDLWDRKKLDKTRKKIKKLDIFKYIALAPQKLSHQQSKKPITLTLLDDAPYEIKLRGGYLLTSKNFLLKRDSTYKLGSSLIIKNPLNYADKLTFKADVTRFEKDFVFDYQLPEVKFQLYSHQYIHPLEVAQSNSAYEALEHGGLIGFSKEYKSQYFWGLNIGNEWMKTCRARGNLNLAPSMINRTIPYFSLEPNLIIDHLDDKLNTTRGSFTFCSVKLMVPETNRSTTYKIMIDQSLFHPLYHHIIGALRARWGHIFRRQFQEIMPIERFFLGGPYSIRGYTIDTVPPLGATKHEHHTEYTIQGGSSMLNGSAEIRFPIYKSFGGVVFQDIGVLSQSGFAGFKGRWFPTSGWGLRYQTPIGPLRFDIGWKWKRSFPHDCAYAWYLTIGQAF